MHTHISKHMPSRNSDSSITLSALYNPYTACYIKNKPVSPNQMGFLSLTRCEVLNCYVESFIKRRKQTDGLIIL